MSEELKPCPFCGSSDIDAEGVMYYKNDDDYDMGRTSTYPACNDCDAACKAWNTRAAEKANNGEALQALDELKGAIAYHDTKVIDDILETIRKFINSVGEDVSCKGNEALQADQWQDISADDLCHEFAEGNDCEDYPFKGELYDIELVTYAYQWLLYNYHLIPKEKGGIGMSEAATDYIEFYDWVNETWVRILK